MSLLEIQRDYTFDAERGLKVRSVMQKKARRSTIAGRKDVSSGLYGVSSTEVPRAF
jgi:hypothetical protein